MITAGVDGVQGVGGQLRRGTIQYSAFTSASTTRTLGWSVAENQPAQIYSFNIQTVHFVIFVSQTQLCGQFP